MTYALNTVVLMFFLSGCLPAQSELPATLVNSGHLDDLYEEVVLDSLPAAFVYIYAEYPDYRRVEAPGEGIACVDDVARAAVFYLRHYQYRGEQTSLHKARKLLQFLLDMQASNGLFYNFIDQNYSINATRENSRPGADWWTWRALWALGEAYPLYTNIEQGFAETLKARIRKIFPAIDSLSQKYPERQDVNGFTRPAYLPNGAADQGAVMLLGLIPYYQSTQDTLVAYFIRNIAGGLMTMQINDASQFADGAFLSWQNIWHAWGNSQADALLRAGNSLKEPQYMSSALREVSQFYARLKDENFPGQIVFTAEDRQIKEQERLKFPQIAYGIRPMVMASLTAAELTGEEHYARQAGELVCWLLGQNPAGQAMYDPQTGRCFDGINHDSSINKNSGAESTIEALLSLLAVEQNPISRKVVQEYYRQRRSHE